MDGQPNHEAPDPFSSIKWSALGADPKVFRMGALERGFGMRR